MRKCDVDYSLYLVTDRAMAAGRSLGDMVASAVAGGCTVVQIREKEAGTGAFYERALRLKAVTDALQVPLIVNDRVDIMLAVGAAGVHLGQSDLPADVARGIIGPEKILGVSAQTLEEAQKAERDGADYLGVGAVFSTTTKRDAEAVTLETLRSICQTVHIPVVAIGGVSRKTISALAGTGIRGVAVVSDIMKDPRPGEAARTLRTAVDEMKERHR